MPYSVQPCLDDKGNETGLFVVVDSDGHVVHGPCSLGEAEQVCENLNNPEPEPYRPPSP